MASNIKQQVARAHQLGHRMRIETSLHHHPRTLAGSQSCLRVCTDRQWPAHCNPLPKYPLTGQKDHSGNLMRFGALAQDDYTSVGRGMEMQSHPRGATGSKDVIVAFTYEVEGNTVYGVAMLLFDAAYPLNQMHSPVGVATRTGIPKLHWSDSCHEHAASYLFVSL